MSWLPPAVAAWCAPTTDGPALTSAAGAAAPPPVLSLGVEEELHLLSADTLALVPRAVDVQALLRPVDEDGSIAGELTLSQVETVISVCDSLPEARRRIIALRGRVGDAARAVGLRPASCGTAPLGGWRGQQIAGGPAYASLEQRMGRLAREQQIAGLHVHVGAPGRDDGWHVAVLDRLRPWLAVLAALSASSPWWDGADTGFASWRQVGWRRWPASGPPPLCGTREGYDAAVATLVAAGLADGPRQVYWDARLSARFPTVEVRICDALPTVDEAVALTGLVLALAQVALGQADAGVPAPAVSDRVLLAAGWRAARWGLSGDLVDPRATDGRTVPAREAVAALLAHVDEVVDPAVRATLARWSSPAERQRSSGSARAAARLVVEETLAGVPRGSVVRPSGQRGDDADERRLRADVPPHHSD